MIEKHLFELSFKRYLNHTYTRKDAEKVFAGIGEEDNRRWLEKSMLETWKESAQQAQCSEEQAEQYRKEAQALLRKLNPPKPFISRYGKTLFRVAASILILLTIGLGNYHYNRSFNDRNGHYTILSTASGESKSMLLPDGTVATLNACSRITFPESFTGSERRIQLEGEAYFQVAKNEKQPFFISTPQFDIQVLGTEFNVKAYSEDEMQAINVKNGKVQVELPEATIRLTADEHLEINRLTANYGKRKEIQTIAAWRQGSLYFNRTPIRDVAHELERVYGCRIEFEEGQTFNNLITGEHTNSNLESVLRSIEYAAGIHCQYDRKNDIILLYK